MARLTAVKREIERFGYWRTAYRILLDKLSPVLQLYFINSRYLGSGKPEDTPARVGWATPAELETATAYMGENLTNAFVEKALARGDKCLAAFMDGKMVSFVWRAYGSAPHTNGIWVRFGSAYRYGYKAYTLPEFRGRHILDPKYSDQYDLEHGIHQSVGFIATHNFSSLERERRIADFAMTGVAGYLSVFGKTLFFRSPSVKKIGFEFYIPTETA